MFSSCKFGNLLFDGLKNEYNVNHKYFGVFAFIY